MEPKRTAEQNRTLARCRGDYDYFLKRFAYIEDATDGEWRRFDLWPAQSAVLATLMARRQVIVLKARQLGLTWLTLGYVLAEILFRPITVALFFSRGETEAKDLLVRLKGVYSRLPDWMKDSAVVIDNSQEWRLSTGSRALSFPTTGGRSYTASIVVVDEADFIERFNEVMNAVKPTVDAGGKMILISTVDKGKPNSAFKQIYRGAKGGRTEWTPVFLSWHARPDRDANWYAEQKADILARTGSQDDLHQEYPATDAEALAHRTLDKRIPAAWLNNCYTQLDPIDDPPGAPAIPGLKIYRTPQPGHRYVIGGDPAEGNPTSDDSSLTVLDVDTGEEVAMLAGKIEMSVLGNYANQIGIYYNRAPIMVERNNHGHTVLQWIEQNGQIRRLTGHDHKRGWLSSNLGKAILYNHTADAFKEGETTLHSFETFTQLSSIEGDGLRAPQGDPDDLADSYALAIAGRWRILNRNQENSQPASTSLRTY